MCRPCMDGDPSLGFETLITQGAPHPADHRLSCVPTNGGMALDLMSPSLGYTTDRAQESRAG